jgi:hypothetical protein
MTYKAQHLSVAINRSAEQVYAFAADPDNLPRWAAGLSSSIQHVNGTWVADSPMGRVTVQFVAPNPFGILDHYVTLPTGETVYNPLRVVANNAGSEVIFTVYQRPEMSDAMFADDARAVTRDLERLKALLEAASPVKRS